MKETYYLKHDYNSRNDEKVLRLRMKYEDGSGYAIYWMLLEKLGESSEGRLKLEDIEYIGYDLHFSCDRIADVIHQHMLFENDGMYFWSNRLLSDLAGRDEKSKQGRLAAKVRWDKERKKMQTHCSGNADAMQGEDRIGEDRRESTPSQKMKIFLDSVKNKDAEYLTLLSTLEANGIPNPIVVGELDKFSSYWAELNKAGTRQRWELEKTFEVQRRLATWFSRIGGFGRSNNRRGRIIR